MPQRPDAQPRASLIRQVSRRSRASTSAGGRSSPRSRDCTVMRARCCATGCGRRSGQDSLVRALSRMASWTTGDSPRRWLFTLMHNLFVDQLRRARCHVRRLPRCLRPSMRSSVPHRRSTGLHRWCLQPCGSRFERRTALVLVAVEGLSYADAAEYARHSGRHADVAGRQGQAGIAIDSRRHLAAPGDQGDQGMKPSAEAGLPGTGLAHRRSTGSGRLRRYLLVRAAKTQAFGNPPDRQAYGRPSCASRGAMDLHRDFAQAHLAAICLFIRPLVTNSMTSFSRGGQRLIERRQRRGCLLGPIACGRCRARRRPHRACPDP